MSNLHRHGILRKQKSRGSKSCRVSAETCVDQLIEGSATEFCQVVTQVRNIADTRLKVAGEAATRWMAIAQCFAGPPETPPAPGSRFRESVPG